MTWTPKFKVGDYILWDKENFYIIDIKNDYYSISFCQNGQLGGYRYGPVIDNGYKTDDGYRNVNSAILLYRTD